jgi:hypothetical protein
LDGNDAMPLPFIAEPLEAPNCDERGGRIEIGEPGGPFEIFDSLIVATALRQCLGAGDESSRVVGVALRANNEVVGSRDGGCGGKAGHLREPRVCPRMSVVVLDDLGEVSKFRCLISSAPLRFCEAEQLSHGPRIGRDFRLQNRSARNRGGRALGRRRRIRYRGGRVLGRQRRIRYRGGRALGRRRRLRHWLYRSPDARPRNCAAEQREDAKTGYGRDDLYTPSARMGTGSEAASRRFGGALQEILANA